MKESFLSKIKNFFFPEETILKKIERLKKVVYKKGIHLSNPLDFENSVYEKGIYLIDKKTISINLNKKFYNHILKYDIENKLSQEKIGNWKKISKDDITSYDDLFKKSLRIPIAQAIDILTNEVKNCISLNDMTNKIQFVIFLEEKTTCGEFIRLQFSYSDILGKNINLSFEEMESFPPSIDCYEALKFRYLSSIV